MAVRIENSTSSDVPRTYVYLTELQVEKAAEVRILICRAWDTHTSFGKYLSSEFIASDEKGNVIQLTVRNTVSHLFLTRLQEGSVYLLNNFEVIPNKDDYRLLKDNPVLIQLQGSTFVRRLSLDATAGFIRHPFTCVPFDDLAPTDGKYLIDVVGCAINVGSTTPTRTGTRTLEFDLANERGRRVRVTLWGKLGDAFLARKPAPPAQYNFILASVTAKRDYFGGTSLSSTSATLIIDDIQIPTLHDFINRLGDRRFPDGVEDSRPEGRLPAPKEGTLAELLQMVRRGKNNVADVFKCKVELLNIRMKNGWYYNSCSICKARKSITRQSGGFWCESCDKNVPEPTTRFRVQFDVKDDTAETVVVLFDETAEQLSKTTAECLLAEQNAETCNTVLPNALANLLNTTQVILLKTNSYYEHGSFESFNCIKVYLDEPVAAVLEDHDPITPPAEASAKMKGPATSTPKGTKRTIEVPTPAKALEPPSRRKFIVLMSDSEDEQVPAA